MLRDEPGDVVYIAIRVTLADEMTNSGLNLATEVFETRVTEKGIARVLGSIGLAGIEAKNRDPKSAAHGSQRDRHCHLFARWRLRTLHEAFECQERGLRIGSTRCHKPNSRVFRNAMVRLSFRMLGDDQREAHILANQLLLSGADATLGLAAGLPAAIARTAPEAVLTNGLA